MTIIETIRLNKAGVGEVMQNKARNQIWLWIGLFAVMFTSCTMQIAGAPDGEPTSVPSTKASFSPDDLIEPGDTIGDFLITTGEPGKFITTWDHDCDRQGEFNKSCEASLNTIFNISVGIAAKADYDLDQLWSEVTYEMVIDDHPVDLPAFGTVDLVDPVVGDIRHWNIVLVPSKPGEISIRILMTFPDHTPLEYTITFVFR